MLHNIHNKGHMGIEKYRKRACEELYWPYMNQSITEMVKSCSTYMKYQMEQPSEQLQPHPVINYP